MTKTTEKKNIASLIVTGVFALGMLPGAVMNLVQPPMVEDMAAHLGIPLALLTLVGVWKILGLVALVGPVPPRLREWAYAGFFFDLTGAAILHIAAGDGVDGVAPSLGLAALLVGSYVLRLRGAPAATVVPAVA